MAKRVFFSFHYADVASFRANVVRNSWVTQEREDAGFFDASIWESAKKQGDIAIKRLINNGIQNTSATAVLIGSDTYERRWVRYEIFKSIEKQNNLIGIHINNIKCKDGLTKNIGSNPFDYIAVKSDDHGNFLEYHEYKNGKWVLYQDCPVAVLKFTNKTYHGKTVQLSSVYPVISPFSSAF